MMYDRQEMLAAMALILDQCAAQFSALAEVYGDFLDIADRIISYRDDFIAYTKLEGFENYKKSLTDE